MRTPPARKTSLRKGRPRRRAPVKPALNERTIATTLTRVKKIPTRPKPREVVIKGKRSPRAKTKISPTGRKRQVGL